MKQHLRVAGCQGQLFSDGNASGVHDGRTKRVARKTINVCRSALLLGATEKKESLDEPI
jgi:hypothetical protein